MSDNDAGQRTPAGDFTAAGVGNYPYGVIVLASTARTASPVAATDRGFPVPAGANAIHLVVSVTADPAAASVVFNLEGFDKASSTWYSILASAAVAAVGVTQYQAFPGAPATANVSANTILPERVRVRPVHADADSFTYSVGATFSCT